MGNTQSSLETPAPRSSLNSPPDLSPSRLSKPKPVNPTNEGLPHLNPGGLSTSLNCQSAVLPARPENAALETNPAPIMCPFANVTEGNSEEVKAKLGGRKGSLRLMQEKAARRMSLFRSKSSQGNPHKEKGASTVRPRSRNCTTATSPRSNSVTFESAAAAGYLQPQPRQESWAHPPQTRLTWNHDTATYASQRLINLAEEPAFVHTTAVSERATTMTERSWNGRDYSEYNGAPDRKYSWNGGDHFEYNRAPDRKHSWTGEDYFEYDGAPINRADSDLSLYVPVRRRSILQTPGVATRRTSTRDGLTHSQSVRYSHPQTPQISRQQSIESFREGILSMPPSGLDPLLLQRVVTPCEDEYQSIGAFKLGTLRITNGSASPMSPELEGQGQRVDYFSSVQSSLDSRAEASQYLQIKMPQPRVVKPANNVLAALSQDSTQPEYSANEVLDVRLDPNAKSQPSTSPSISDAAATVARTDSGFMSISDESLNTKPLSKADSGYSSNVSLHSLHTKSKISDREKNKPNEIQISPVKVQDFGLDIPLSVSPLMMSESEAFPSFPPKDTPPISPLEGGQMFENLRKSLSVRGQHTKAGLLTPKSSQKSEKRPSLSGSSPKSPELNSLTPASTKSSKSDCSNSALSISSTSQKPSRLQRFLSGARRPNSSLPTHSRHALEEKSVPAIPKDVEHEFREHSRRFPMTARRLALKPRSSMDTLKTIFSVGSVEASLEATTANQTITTVPEAETGELTATKGVSWRKSIRKSMARRPVRNNKADVKEGHEEEQPGVYDSILPPKTGKVYGSTVKNTSGSDALKEAEMADSRLPCDRTMSLTVSLERTLNMQMVGAHPNLAGLPTELPPASLPSPVIPRTASMTFDHKTTHHQPPVSMQSRRGSLRVPLPHLRPQSSTSSLRHEVSREDIHSYPSVQSSRRPSRESIHSYPMHEQVAQNYSAHEELGTIGQDYLGTSATPPQMDPRRLAAFRQRQNTLPPTYRVPDWNPPTRSDISRQSSMASSHGTSHHNLVSTQSQDSSGIHRPSSAQPRHSSYTQRAQTLRHRPSHDAYQQLRLQNANPPDMSSVYGVLATDPWSNPNIDCKGPQGHVVPDSTYPPYVPRQTGHHRKRSMSMHISHGPNPPYRVLHSYNSPAYRNAPIWG